MAKNEILSEIKKAEESAKTMVDEAIEAKNKRISDARAEAREILKQAEVDAHKAAQDSFKEGEEKILEERDKIVNDGEKNALAMSQKAQANIDKSVNYLVNRSLRGRSLMSRPKRMTKAVIVGHKSILKETIDALHDSNLFHIEDFVEDESGFKISKPFKNAEEVSKKLVKIRSIANYLGIESKKPVVQKSDSVLRDLDSKLNELDRAISAKTEQFHSLKLN